MQELLLPWKISLSVVKFAMYVSISVSGALASTSSLKFILYCLQGGKTEKIAIELVENLVQWQCAMLPHFPSLDSDGGADIHISKLKFQ